MQNEEETTKLTEKRKTKRLFVFFQKEPMMITEITAFRWHVYSGGYVCQELNRNGKCYRAIGPNLDSSTHDDYLKPCYPMEQPGLHQTFAGLKLTEEAIVAFANKWGPLKKPHVFHDSGDGFDQEAIGEFSWVNEAIDTWYTQIKKMKALLQLWRALKSGTDISKFIELRKEKGGEHWRVDICFKKMPELKRDHTFRERDWPGFYGQLDHGGTRELARIYLFDLINESLWGTCSPWLSIGDKLEVVAWCFSPHDLDGALWLMFAQEILGEKKVRQCLYCKGFFDTAKEEDHRRKRNDKKYCSDKCRVGAFRERSGDLPI